MVVRYNILDFETQDYNRMEFRIWSVLIPEVFHEKDYGFNSTGSRLSDFNFDSYHWYPTYQMIVFPTIL